MRFTRISGVAQWDSKESVSGSVIVCEIGHQPWYIQRYRQGIRDMVGSRFELYLFALLIFFFF